MARCDNLRIAVISDLHVGRARGKDLCVDSTPQDLIEYGESDFVGRFTGFLSEKAHLAADYLVIPGDVSHEGFPDQINRAATVVEQAAEALGVPLGRIVYVPGNHDVDWSLTDRTDPTNTYHRLRYSAFVNQNSLFRRIASVAEGDLFVDPYFSIWSMDDLFVLGYNSSWSDSRREETHHGDFGVEHSDRIRQRLSDLDIGDEKVRLLLVHHHPLNYPVPGYQPRPDFSALQNAESLIEVAHDFQFDVLVHGHRHHPRLTIRGDTNGHFLPIVCAGSFSAHLDPNTEGAVRNQFHMISLSGNPGENVRGNLSSWSYTRAKGWEPSREELGGIRHEDCFGCYRPSDEIALEIEQSVRERLDSHRIVRWSWIVQNYENLAYLPRRNRDGVFHALRSRLRFTIRTMDDDVILLQE